MKKHLSIILAVVLIVVLGASSVLMMNMKHAIEDLQSEVARFKPYYTSTLAATYGENGTVKAADVLDNYEKSAQLYVQYGISVDSYGWDTKLKTDILEDMTKSAILYDKAVEMGLDTLSESELEEINASVESTIAKYVDNYTNYYYPDQEVTDLIRSEAEAYWAENGITRASYTETLKKNAVLQKLKDAITADISVSEDDIKALYDSLLAEQKKAYDGDSIYYISAVNDDDVVLYHPDGYRNVNYILIGFDDDQSKRRDELTQTLESLNSERTAAEKNTSASNRSLEEIDADIAACSQELDELYAAVSDRATAITEAYQSGTPFNELVKEYYPELLIANEEGSRTYPVCADNDYWEDSFTEAAMNLKTVGDISEPVRGRRGLYIIYYDSDRVAYTVSYEEARDSLADQALEDAKKSCYDAQVSAWMSEADPVYYYENIGITKSTDTAS